MGLSSRLSACLLARAPESSVETLARIYEERWKSIAHGDAQRWQAAVDDLPHAAEVDYAEINGTVVVGEQTNHEPDRVRTAVRQLMPWRKGPFRIAGLHVDCEWRSDWKWQRLADHIQPLNDRLVLDVGCGNGYYIWRMLLAGAAAVLGVEPTLLFHYQHRAITKLAAQSADDLPIDILPAALEQMPDNGCRFDTVFSMGVLYHRRSPLDHLQQLHRQLKTNGELVLETLVLDGPGNECLIPRNRYAQMRNVWFIPTVSLVKQMLERTQFQHIRVIDVTPTTIGEQRRTEWMEFESLEDGLDPHRADRTVEGYPAPRRAIFLADRG